MSFRGKNDLAGKRFTRLTVIRFSHHAAPGRRPVWLCRCDCGTENPIRGQSLLSGATTSCGCLHRETVTVHGHYVNDTPSPTYNSWLAMMTRCRLETHRFYHLYGGAGITVCERWHSFANFLSDMGERPEGMTLDRVDNDGNYELANCRWATWSEQNRNRGTYNRRLNIEGREVTVSEWAELTGMSVTLIRQRVDAGWTAEDAVFTPVGRPRGERKKVSEERNVS